MIYQKPVFLLQTQVTLSNSSFFGSSVYPVTNEKRLINSEVHDY